jgi:serine/threonine protein kinase
MENWGDQGISSLAMELFGDYLARREAGEVVDLAALSARHPEVARELEELDSQHRRLYAQGVFVASAIDPHAARPSGGGLGELERVLSRLAGREASYRRYRILGVIAKGGMGIVLRVYDRDLRRELAMKVLKNRAAGRRGTPGFDVARAGRLLDEAQITAQLDHPGIPPIHEVGLAPDGELYFTMKLISGARTLADVLARHHAPREAPSSAEWSLPRLLALVQRACEAVAYAHERGVIHRDLKPANILVGDFGEVYVTDWGVARVLGTVRVRAAADRGRARQVRSFRSDQKRGHLETPLATLSGRTVGTPEYMSPEQAQGRLDVLDRRSDVFSMGALLYHVLSGHPPFRRERPMNDAERLGQVAFGTPRPLRALVPSVPPELEAICERAMACAQEQRYADMQALARDLGAYLEGRVVRAYETGPLAELRKWVQRNRGLAGVGGVAALSLVVGLILFLQWGARRRSQLSEGEPGTMPSTKSGSNSHSRACRKETQPEGNPSCIAPSALVTGSGSTCGRAPIRALLAIRFMGRRSSTWFGALRATGR